MTDADGAIAGGLAGRTYDFDAFAVACVFTNDSKHLAYALGDGAVKIVAIADAKLEAISVDAHKGATLSLAPHPAGGFLSGGDDGKVARVAIDGTITTIAIAKSKWIEHLAANTASNVIAWSEGKDALVLAAKATAPKRFPHASTIGGLAFDPKGKRLAAAIYNGVSLWWANADEPKANFLEWKGSHIGVSFHPAGDYLVTTMQENALHGWRLSDGEHMRMAGYPAKAKSAAWTPKGKFLATSGSERVVCWPFDGKGPMGRAPTMLGPEGTFVAVVASHPTKDLIAAGYEDGSVWLNRVADDRFTCVRAPSSEKISCLAWSPDGNRLAYGSEDGASGVMAFLEKRS